MYPHRTDARRRRRHARSLSGRERRHAGQSPPLSRDERAALRERTRAELTAGPAPLSDAEREREDPEYRWAPQPAAAKLSRRDLNDPEWLRGPAALNIQPFPARRFGDRTQWKLLGQGAYGRVWLTPGRKMVLKEIDREKESALDRLQLIWEEVSALARLRPACRDYLLCYQAVFEDSTSYYIQTEYLEHYRDLSTIIYAKGDERLYRHSDWRTHAFASKVVVNLIRGMQVMHDQQVVHLDLKPENIMVHTKTGHIKYIDFGFGCVGKRCQVRDWLGTPHYVASEFWLRPHRFEQLVARLRSDTTLEPAGREDVYTYREREDDARILEASAPVSPVAVRAGSPRIAPILSGANSPARITNDRAVVIEIEQRLARLPPEVRSKLPGWFLDTARTPWYAGELLYFADLCRIDYWALGVSLWEFVMSGQSQPGSERMLSYRWLGAQRQSKRRSGLIYFAARFDYTDPNDPLARENLQVERALADLSAFWNRNVGRRGLDRPPVQLSLVSMLQRDPLRRALPRSVLRPVSKADTAASAAAPSRPNPRGPGAAAQRPYPAAVAVAPNPAIRVRVETPRSVVGAPTNARVPGAAAQQPQPTAVAIVPNQPSRVRSPPRVAIPRSVDAPRAPPPVVAPRVRIVYGYVPHNRWTFVRPPSVAAERPKHDLPLPRVAGRGHGRARNGGAGEDDTTRVLPYDRTLGHDRVVDAKRVGPRDDSPSSTVVSSVGSSSSVGRLSKDFQNALDDETSAQRQDAEERAVLQRALEQRTRPLAEAGLVDRPYWCEIGRGAWSHVWAVLRSPGATAAAAAAAPTTTVPSVSSAAPIRTPALPTPSTVPLSSSALPPPSSAPLSSNAPLTVDAKWIVLKEIRNDGLTETWKKIWQEITVLERLQAGAPAVVAAACRDYLSCSVGLYGDGTSFYLASDYMTGYVTLQALLEQRGLFQEDAPTTYGPTQLVFQHLMAGLKTMHALGVAHRDIKPANIMVHTERFTVKYIDFGEACYSRTASRPAVPPNSALGTDAAPPSTSSLAASAAVTVSECEATTSAVGTPDYMAPEVLFRCSVQPWLENPRRLARTDPAEREWYEALRAKRNTWYDRATASDELGAAGACAASSRINASASYAWLNERDAQRADYWSLGIVLWTIVYQGLRVPALTNLVPLPLCPPAQALQPLRAARAPHGPRELWESRRRVSGELPPKVSPWHVTLDFLATFDFNSADDALAPVNQQIERLVGTLLSGGANRLTLTGMLDREPRKRFL